jgi:hypothetical protein
VSIVADGESKLPVGQNLLTSSYLDVEITTLPRDFLTTNQRAIG